MTAGLVITAGFGGADAAGALEGAGPALVAAAAVPAIARGSGTAFTRLTVACVDASAFVGGEAGTVEGVVVDVAVVVGLGVVAFAGTVPVLEGPALVRPLLVDGGGLAAALPALPKAMMAAAGLTPGGCCETATLTEGSCRLAASGGVVEAACFDRLDFRDLAAAVAPDDVAAPGFAALAASVVGTTGAALRADPAAGAASASGTDLFDCVSAWQGAARYALSSNRQSERVSCRNERIMRSRPEA
ncbi:hypothetical protein [uncultured Nevskia sp.]|uniref:hypothetical protein n=1 Tax=uncultured Nevskia sp. TaxID=228950 RepID=UPI0025FCE01E|nr:hypothetical protein [uncultured Nevskia sp.]